MSRELLRELVSAVTRLRRETADVGQVDEWAGRLEQHLAEIELLVAMALPDDAGPAFTARLGPDPLAAPAGPAAEPAPATPAGPEGTPARVAGARDAGPPPVPWSVLGAVAEVRSGRVSPEELVDRAFRTARRLSHLNAFIELFEEQARREAQALEWAGEPHSRGAGAGVPLLAGVPVAVKDLVAIRGYAMTGGSRVLEQGPAAQDAEAVRRLRAHGAVMVGAANLHELAYGVTSENPHFGSVRNPRNPEHVAGGSSGGSAAAVGAGIVPAALGTDTGGSIRIPAAACGVAGLKPTYGRVPTQGVFPLAWTLDHAGPLAASAADLAVLFAVLADDARPEEQGFARALVEGAAAGWGRPGARGPAQDAVQQLPEALRHAAALALATEAVQAAEGTGRPARDGGGTEALARAALAGLRVGRPPEDWLGPLDPAVRRGLAEALHAFEEMGARPVVTPLPLPGHFRVAQFAIIQSEAASVHRERLRRHWDRLGADVRVRLKIGEFLTAVDYLQAQRLRRLLCQRMAAIFEGVDVLVLPALPVLPPKLGTRMVEAEGRVEPVQRALTRFTAPFNLTGLPAVCVPVATAEGGLPVAVQLVAGWGRELDALRAAIALEARVRR